ncbi:MAG: tetratricopeptide repeat protein [Paludibacteraceae bacterium]
MDTTKSIKRIIEQIEQRLSEQRLAEALRLLSRLADEVQQSTATSVVDEIKLVYEQMLAFALKGTADAQREQIFRQLMQKAYALFDDLCEVYCIQNAAFFDCRSNRKTPSLSVCLERLQAAQDRVSNNSLLSDVFVDVNRETPTPDYSKQLYDLYYSVLFTSRFSENELKKLSVFITDETNALEIRCVAVTALMLSVLRFFQKEKIMLLLTLSSNRIDTIRQRALVAVVFVLLRYALRFACYDDLKEKLASLSADAAFVSELEVVLCHFIRSGETELINQKIKEDLLPDMMRVTPTLNDKWRDAKKKNTDEETAMDEALELFDEIGLTEKLEQFNEMQREGSDVNMSTFSELKSFPFFDEAFNWFLPFSSKNEAVKSLFEGNNEFMSLLMSIDTMCDSDKYSFCFILQQLPASQIDFMKQGFKAQIEDACDRMQTDARLTFSLQTNNYVQCLYRFYKLFPQKMSYNPFVHLGELSEVNALWQLLGDKGQLSVADFYFSRKMYAESLTIYERANVSESLDTTLLRKLAYAHQRVGEWRKALELYTKIDLLTSEQKWILRQMALCHKNCGEGEQALSCYRRLLQLAPDDNKIQMSFATCLYEQKKYAEALEVYFKINYFNPDNENVLRAIAWCAFLCGKAEQSETYFSKIPTENLVAIDHLRWAFVAFFQSNLDKASTLFRQAYLCDKQSFWSNFESVTVMLKESLSTEEMLWKLTEYVNLLIYK